MSACGTSSGSTSRHIHTSEIKISRQCDMQLSPECLCNAHFEFNISPQNLVALKIAAHRTDLHKAVLQGSVLFLLSSAVWAKRFSHCACRFTFVWHLPQQMLLNVTTTEFQIPLWESGTYKLAQMPKRCIVLSLPPLRANALCLLAVKIGLHQA